MSYEKSRVEQLMQLLKTINGRKEHPYAAPTYKDSPDLQQIASLVLPWPDNEPETLTDAIAVLQFLTDSYTAMGRSAVAMQYFRAALEAYQALAGVRPLTEEEQEGARDILYNAVRAANHYRPDSCKAWIALASGAIPEEVCREARDKAVARQRISIKHDPVEATEAYLAVIDEVDKLVDENKTMDFCHETWQLKTMYLAQRGITWKSPAVMNPRVMFD